MLIAHIWSIQGLHTMRAMLIAHKWSIQGLPVDWWGEAFEGEEELAAVFAFEEIEVALAAVLFGEGDAGGGFGGSGRACTICITPPPRWGYRRI